MKRVKVTYGIGYGSHETELEFDDADTDEEIEEGVSDYVRDRLWWCHEIDDVEETK